jgi:hypothetical protein
MESHRGRQGCSLVWLTAADMQHSLVNVWQDAWVPGTRTMKSSTQNGWDEIHLVPDLIDGENGTWKLTNPTKFYYSWRWCHYEYTTMAWWWWGRFLGLEFGEDKHIFQLICVSCSYDSQRATSSWGRDDHHKLILWTTDVEIFLKTWCGAKSTRLQVESAARYLAGWECSEAPTYCTNCKMQNMSRCEWTYDVCIYSVLSCEKVLGRGSSVAKTNAAQTTSWDTVEGYFVWFYVLRGRSS